MFYRNTYKLALCLVLAIATLSYGCAQIVPKPKIELAGQAQTQTDKTLTGLVIKVFDGDTILVKETSSGTATRVRLKGIDAPESKQSYGPEAAKQMTSLTLNKLAEVQWSETDQYGRTIGKVIIDGTDVCLEMVKAGLAWHFKQYQTGQSQKDRVLYDSAEKEAREQRKGLWAEDHPTPPWDYRRQERERMNNNGKSGNGDGRQNDDHLVDLTLGQMQETERVSELTDLALALEIRESGLTDDSRIYELLSRVYPNWLNQAEIGDTTGPTHIAFAVPIAVAYDEMAYDHCRCAGPEAPADSETSPCIYCACQAALFKATKNEDFRPRPRLL